MISPKAETTPANGSRNDIHPERFLSNFDMVPTPGENQPEPLKSRSRMQEEGEPVPTRIQTSKPVKQRPPAKPTKVSVYMPAPRPAKLPTTPTL